MWLTFLVAWLNKFVTAYRAQWQLVAAYKTTAEVSIDPFKWQFHHSDNRNTGLLTLRISLCGLKFTEETVRLAVNLCLRCNVLFSAVELGID